MGTFDLVMISHFGDIEYTCLKIGTKEHCVKVPVAVLTDAAKQNVIVSGPRVFLLHLFSALYV